MAIFTIATAGMNKSVHKGLFYIFLLGIYGIFFSVQWFHNFEGQPNTGRLFGHSVAKNTPFHSAASQRFRLNKRYEPEDIPPCPIFSLAAPERGVKPVRLGDFGKDALPSVAIRHYSLRGPPATA